MTTQYEYSQDNTTPFSSVYKIVTSANLACDHELSTDNWVNERNIVSDAQMSYQESFLIWNYIAYTTLPPPHAIHQTRIQIIYTPATCRFLKFKMSEISYILKKATYNFFKCKKKTQGWVVRFLKILGIKKTSYLNIKMNKIVCKFSWYAWANRVFFIIGFWQKNRG